MHWPIYGLHICWSLTVSGIRSSFSCVPNMGSTSDLDNTQGFSNWVSSLLEDHMHLVVAEFSETFLDENEADLRSIDRPW